MQIFKCAACDIDWIAAGEDGNCVQCDGPLAVYDDEALGDSGEDQYDDSEAAPLLQLARGGGTKCPHCSEPLPPARSAHPLCVVAQSGDIEELTFATVFNNGSASYDEVKRLVHVVRHWGREADLVKEKIETKKGEVLMSDFAGMSRAGAALALDLVTVCGGTVASALYDAYAARRAHGKKATAKELGIVSAEIGIGFIPILGPFMGLVKGGGMALAHAATPDARRKLDKFHLATAFLMACRGRIHFAEAVVAPAIEALVHDKKDKQQARYAKNIRRIMGAAESLNQWVRDNLARDKIDEVHVPLLLDVG